MLAFYNTGILLYHFAIHIASLFQLKAKDWLEGRAGLLNTIEEETGNFSGRTLWVHCASLGEFEMARPIMEKCKASDADLRIVLTFFSPSGYEIRKHYETADHVFYLPLDTRLNAERFVKAIRPTTVIFVKYDLWYHHLNEAKKAGAGLVLISAQFRTGQQYFKFYGAIARKALQLFDKIFLVDAHSEKLLHQIDVKHTVVCGDTRYDRVMEVAQKAEPILAIEQFKSTSKLVVCGSTWPEDEKLLASCVQKFPDTKWIIAPHEVGESNIQRLQNLFPKAVRFSVETEQDGNVILVDSIGILNRMYRYADVAYVGGAFRTGLHNILEATAYGTPTVFGPDHTRFPDAGEMAEKGLAFSIRNEAALHQRFDLLLNTDQTELRTSIIRFMESRMGATNSILHYLNHA